MPFPGSGGEEGKGRTGADMAQTINTHMNKCINH
jgi:hypothetical protein